jgi:hypothetical protein
VKEQTVKNVDDVEKSTVNTLAVGTLRAAAWAPGPRSDGGWAETHSVPWHGAQFEGDGRISLAACDRTKLTSRCHHVFAQLTVFYTLLFVVPSLAAFAYTGGKTQLSREELLASEAAKAKLREKFGPEDEERLKERKAMMNKVLFETKGDMRQDWAIKRDEERARKRALQEQQQQQQK